MGFKWVIVGLFILVIPLIHACPENYSDCMTWGNEKSMMDHSALVKNDSCNVSIRVSFDSGKERWGHLLINYHDAIDGKDSYAVYKDGIFVGSVSDLHINETLWAFGKTFFWPQKVTGRHEIEIKKTEINDCEPLTINWIALQVDENYYSGGSRIRRGGSSAGGGSSDGGSSGEPVNPPEEIPEFGVLGLGVALIGSAVLFGVVRKRK
jgi:hypothetical protein